MDKIACNTQGIVPIKGKLYQHQMEAYERGVCEETLALLFDMGLGKSLTTLAIMGRRFVVGEVSRALIVCPRSVCSVWQEELEKFADFDYKVCVVSGSKEVKWQQIRDMRDCEEDVLKIVIINYEALWRIMDDIVDFAPEMIICDESHRIKNPMAKQSKCLHYLGDLTRYKMILTGTPVQNSPLDFFSQYRFLNPWVFGRDYKAFKCRYTLMGGYKNYEIIGYRFMDELVAKVHGHGLRVAKEEALDLPQQLFVKQYAMLNSTAERIYKGIARKVIGQCMKDHSQAVALARLLKLQQLAGGYIDDTDNGQMTLVSDHKLKLLRENIEEEVIRGGKKVVVFARFLHEIDGIEKVLKEMGVGAVTLCGRTKNRAEKVRVFQQESSVKVFVAQIQTAGVGLTLTAAQTAIYYSTTYSYADYAQSLARIHRIGQAYVCTYIFLIAEGTIDEMIYKTLEKKQDLAQLLVDDWEQLIEQSKKRKEGAKLCMTLKK